MPPLDLGAALRAAQTADPASIPDIVESVASSFGATDLVVYLVDFAQATLEPLPDRRTHADLPASEAVATTMAGRAFVSQDVTSADRPDGVRVWAPVVEGSNRTGVIALTVRELTDEVTRACEDLGLFAGCLIATQAQFTDLYELYRRRRSLSLAASMQWDLLPPLVMKTGRMTVAGLLEPAYEIGGDCFDYALNHTVFDLAIVDAMGHGLQAATVASLAVGSYRHDRREGRALQRMHTALDATIAGQFDGSVFATGLLMRADLDTGVVRITNAGHPPPILIRGGAAVRLLACPPTVPWGLAAATGTVPDPSVTTEQLEPGDRVLFYTDGVIEARTADGEEFGTDRLVDLATRHADDLEQAEEVVRHIVGAVLEHQSNQLPDDATVVLFEWNG
ncbi:MAG TPA: PP2C family protein-serine/threonine phosphatase [Acidimicrobiales bacterium]|nr:PP2C family protein-serine/threonine phosphatase [Acidimicrobiales bacterium]